MRERMAASRSAGASSGQLEQIASGSDSRTEDQRAAYTGSQLAGRNRLSPPQATRGGGLRRPSNVRLLADAWQKATD